MWPDSTKWYGFENLDVIYTICDAEINSDYKVHAEFERLQRKHNIFTKTFANFLRPLVQKSMKRHNFNPAWHPTQVVATKISENWVQVYALNNKEKHGIRSSLAEIADDTLCKFVD